MTEQKHKHRPLLFIDMDKDREIVVINAHTFSNQSLTNAYDKMREYGLKCFECLNAYQQTHKP